MEDEGRIWREFLGILEGVEKPVPIAAGVVVPEATSNKLCAPESATNRLPVPSTETELGLVNPVAYEVVTPGLSVTSGP